MKDLGTYRCYFYGNENRNAPCGYKLVKISKGRKYVHVIKDWSKHSCFNFKFKMPLSWWEDNENKFTRLDDEL